MDATDPARRDGPCITQASNSTTPSSLGKPPKPTLVSSGSSSLILTPAMTASSVSAPALSISMARAQAGPPLALEITMCFGLGCAAAAAAEDTAAVVSIQSLLVILFSLPLPWIVCQFSYKHRELCDLASFSPDNCKPEWPVFTKFLHFAHDF